MGRLKMHALKMQDWKMTDKILANFWQNCGVWKMQDWKMTDNILANSKQNYGVWKMQDWKMTDKIREVSYDSSTDTHQKYTRITMSIGVRHSGQPFGITATASAH